MSQHETRVYPPQSGYLQPMAIGALVVALSAMAFVQVNLGHEQEATNRALVDLTEKTDLRVDILRHQISESAKDLAFVKREAEKRAESQQKTIRSLTGRLQKLERSRQPARVATVVPSEITACQAVSRGLSFPLPAGWTDGRVCFVPGKPDDYDWTGLPGRR